MNAIKDFATSFTSLNLHAINFLLWKKILSLTIFKIINVNRPRTFSFWFHLWGHQDSPLREGLGLWWLTPQGQNFENPTFVGYYHQKIQSRCPNPDRRPYIGKGISNSFKTNFNKNIAWGAHFQFHMTYFKYFIKTILKRTNKTQ